MSEIVFNAAQQAFHQGLLEHPNAPRYNFTSTDYLTHERLQEVKRFEQSFSGATFWKEGAYPDWLSDFVAEVSRTVPFYRAWGAPPKTFEATPTWGRDALKSEVRNLVPDHLPLEAMTVYTTSGTTGSTLPIPTHPNVSSYLLAVTEAYLRRSGVRYPRGSGNVAIALVGYQEKTLTYASLSSALDGAGFLKLNLTPHQWRAPEDRAAFLLDTAPGVITGAPYAFEKLAEIVPTLRPRALVSSAVALHPGHAKRLSETFACPVFDLYSMSECRGIAARHWQDDHFELLAPDLYVEILGPNDEPLPAGQVGEIVVTGGRNVYLPLLRYRTGDRAALAFKNGQPTLHHFEGRQAVRLENAKGEVVPSLDVVHALREFPLVGFSLEQKADRSLFLNFHGGADSRAMADRLEALFGRAVQLQRQDRWEGKPHRFRSQLEGPAF